MDFHPSAHASAMLARVSQFLNEHVQPFEAHYREQVEQQGIYPPPFLEALKQRARDEGLWNLFLTALPEGAPGTPMSTSDYALCAERMGRIAWSSEVFNCSPSDTSTMELLLHAGSHQQNALWLAPLLRGETRASFAMSEPDVSSSDPLNVSLPIRRDSNDYVITGRKWFVTGMRDPRNAFVTVVGITSPDAAPHERYSLVIVPTRSPGLTVVRDLPLMHQHWPHGCCEIAFDHVRVPIDHRLGQEGQGLALAQVLLGPARVHHGMRSIGQCELALDLMKERAVSRRVGGRLLAELGSIGEWIALSRIEIEQARLLALKTAWLIDHQGARAARREIAMLKVVVPRIQVAIAQRAIQVFGSAGLTQDFPLADIWNRGRTLQLADGPDEVHLNSIARQELKTLRPRTAAA